MGILDDAIREHLELKRSHGAADEEVARQEAEALGPARREPASAASFDAGDEPLADAPPPPPDPSAAVGADDGAPPPPPLDLTEPLHAEPSLVDPIAPPPVPIEPVPEPEAEAFAPEPESFAGPPTEAMPVADLPEPPPAEPPLDQPLAPDEPAAAAEPADPLPPEPVEPEPDLDATQVHPLPPFDDDALPPAPARPRESERQPPPAGHDEDVLEETPDFLQDTPEHDRLWFEQKPPRDFDFDD